MRQSRTPLCGEKTHPDYPNILLLKKIYHETSPIFELTRV
jgi:hypothetical protein